VVLWYLRVQAMGLIAEDAQVRLNTGEGVHQMRVAIRRLRTSLATFRPLFTPGAGESLRAELKWLAGVLGPSRDAQVIRADLKEELARQPAELVPGPVLRRVDVEMREAYRTAHEAALAALDSQRYLALVAALERFVLDPPLSPRGRGPARAELRKRVRKACRRVRRAADGWQEIEDTAERDRQLHEVRIAAKRARYAAEAARPVAGRKAKATAKAMEQIQEVLGDHQDAAVQRLWLRDIGMRANLAGENSFAFGRLHGLTNARAAHDEATFADVWASTQKVVAAWPG
jgi:CHAD domain-containing protein